MPLTQQEIETLFAFTKKKLVHFYDLQVELVDHLASSIEEEMAMDANLSFDHALQKVYNRFGIFGFAKVVQEKEAALRKYYRVIWWQAVKQFFKFPKVALTTALFFAVLSSGQMLMPDAKVIVFFLTWIALKAMDIRAHRTSKKILNKKLLLTQNTTAFSFSGLWFPYWFLIKEGTAFENNYVFATAIVAIFIFESAVIQINNQVRKKARELYPEAFSYA